MAAPVCSCEIEIATASARTVKQAADRIRSLPRDPDTFAHVADWRLTGGLPVLTSRRGSTVAFVPPALSVDRVR